PWRSCLNFVGRNFLVRIFLPRPRILGERFARKHEEIIRPGLPWLGLPWLSLPWLGLPRGRFQRRCSFHPASALGAGRLRLGTRFRRTGRIKLGIRQSPSAAFLPAAAT